MAGIAESATSSVVSFAVDKLLTKVVGTISLISGGHRQAEEIKTQLEDIQNNLIRADKMQARDKNENRAIWMLKMRDVAFDLEDIIVTFNLEEKLREERSFVKRCAFITKRWAHLYKISNEIQRLQPRLKETNAQRETYLDENVGGGEGSGSSSSTTDPMHPLRWVLPDAEEDYVIGLEDATTKLVRELLEEDDERRVVSIVGMAGSGKTTLAKHAYIDTKFHFDCYAWADVSNECNVKRVLRNVGRGLGIEGILKEVDNEKQLKEELNKFLKKKRYLVVLDDVWKQEHWDNLSKAFPVKGKKGSKVLLTSRHEKVAFYADPCGKPIVPPTLTEEECWKLFCKKAFGKPDCMSKHLEECGRRMVEKCGRLPLAIVVLGGILATKSGLNEWETVQRNINWHLGKEEPLSSIIALSYDDLSYHLKSCFLYFSLFPEDYPIRAKKLLQLWIAEGFVCKRGNETLNEAAENYLKELISRGMVQVAKWSRAIEGSIKVCRVHDVLRDFSIEKAKDAKFGDTSIFYDNSSSSSSSKVNDSFQRLAIHTLEGNQFDFINDWLATFIKWSITNNHRPRSLLVFYLGEDTKFQVGAISKNLKFLRILDLEEVDIYDEIPREIGKLIHLRYLGLGSFRSSKASVPSSIGNLRMLQTLKFGGYFDPSSVRKIAVRKIPDVLWKMEELRYLSFPCVGALPRLATRHLRIDNLINLHTLKGVEAGSWLKRFGNFTNLVTLKVTARREEFLNVCDFVVKLPYLQSLSLSEKFEGEKITSFRRPPLDKCPKLVRLRIVGAWMRASPNSNPHNQEFPPHLTTLELLSTALEEDPMPALEKLPNLVTLSLSDSHKGRSMVCKAHGFPRLQDLEIVGMDELEEWTVEEGAMPNLRNLRLIGCDRLEVVPEGLSFLTTLQVLKLRLMPSSLVNRIKDETGEDWCKVQHIPSIIIE